MKRSVETHASVDEGSGPVVMTFAHDTMVHTLMTGMDRDFQRHMIHQTFLLTHNLIHDLINTLPGLNQEQKQALYEKYSEENLEQVLMTFFESLQDYQFNVHTLPIVQAIHNLPRMELAETAASMVKLNSFQQKVTQQPETVGGPVDVALISRGEGFVMLKNVGV